MMIKREFIGLRINDLQKKTLQELSKRLGKNYTDTLLYLLEKSGDPKSIDENFESVMREVKSTHEQIETSIEEIRFVSNLLTAFVRKHSKSDIQAGEKMIERAKAEAKINKKTN